MNSNLMSMHYGYGIFIGTAMTCLQAKIRQIESIAKRRWAIERKAQIEPTSWGGIKIPPSVFLVNLLFVTCNHSANVVIKQPPPPPPPEDFFAGGGVTVTRVSIPFPANPAA